MRGVFQVSPSILQFQEGPKNWRRHAKERGTRPDSGRTLLNKITTITFYTSLFTTLDYYNSKYVPNYYLYVCAVQVKTYEL